MKKWLFGLMVLLVIGAYGIVHARAKYEPETGCYIGASLDWGWISAEGNKSLKKDADKFDAAIKDFNRKAGKNHAIFCCFIFFPHGAAWEKEDMRNKYPLWNKDPAGWASPKDYLEACERNKAAILFTVEPWQIQDYLTNWQAGNPAYDATINFAKGCSTAKVPVFVRFAHEMNGSWYPWSEWNDVNANLIHDAKDGGISTQNYVAAFRNFAGLLRQYATNVAIVWCPNQGWVGTKNGVDLFKDYYPGDEYVDWMGIDFYERGWLVKGIGDEKVWGGLLNFGLNNDMKDDPNTSEDESVNFYKTYCAGKNKPLMICETGASLTYRNDWSPPKRSSFSHQWKSGYWNTGEQGWLYAVYGTSFYNKKKIYINIDKELPLLKGILWFQQAKSEDVVVSQEVSKFIISPKKFHVFTGGWCDYRIGYNSTAVSNRQNKEIFYPDEFKLYNGLINNPYFLSVIKK